MSIVLIWWWRRRNQWIWLHFTTSISTQQGRRCIYLIVVQGRAASATIMTVLLGTLWLSVELHVEKTPWRTTIIENLGNERCSRREYSAYIIRWMLPLKRACLKRVVWLLSGYSVASWWHQRPIRRKYRVGIPRKYIPINSSLYNIYLSSSSVAESSIAWVSKIPWRQSESCGIAEPDARWLVNAFTGRRRDEAVQKARGLDEHWWWWWWWW